jgi:hypothetical protein
MQQRGATRAGVTAGSSSIGRAFCVQSRWRLYR